MKSVMAGEYTAPPAQGPMMTEICGMTPEESTFRWNTSAYPPSESTPSWMRAPPESFSPITGAPTLAAWSITLQIFSACASDREPPNTVKSCARGAGVSAGRGEDCGARARAAAGRHWVRRRRDPLGRRQR